MPEKAIDSKIDFNKSEQYILSIRLSTDGFSFSIYNPIRDCYVLFRRKEIETGLSLTANLKQAFKELDFLSYTYKQVNIIFAGKRFTLIPSELFEEDKAEALFYYNYHSRENELVLYNILDRDAAVVLFSMDKSAYNFLSERFAGIRFYSSATPFVEHFATKSRLGSDKKMCVCLQAGFIIVCAYDRGHLVMLNPFDCKNLSDRVYYVLYAWKQFTMDQLKDELYITDEDENGDEAARFADELQRFVQHVSVTKPVTNSINN